MNEVHFSYRETDATFSIQIKSPDLLLNYHCVTAYEDNVSAKSYPENIQACKERSWTLHETGSNVD